MTLIFYGIKMVPFLVHPYDTSSSVDRIVAG